ncbi:hypothetical protein [Brucella pseudogrignonensis]|uniref:hypothetical protein n=1 Tax=Brucella pseudogrignonensis TaxID=419475 RepID=UPI0019506751|nr:hypothetical protein [Brucella pseudogrignonensis]
MSEQRISAYGKRVTEDNTMSMGFTAIDDARYWAEELQKAEYKGLGDTREAARYRVAKRTGVSESYLKRLRYRYEEMTDVAGSAYRALMLAYEEMCQRNYAAADEYLAERLTLRANHETYDEPVQTDMGEGSACLRAELEEAVKQRAAFKAKTARIAQMAAAAETNMSRRYASR